MATINQRNNLPFEVRKEYNRGVDIYQQVQNYELDIISESEFIGKMSEIKQKYDSLTESKPLLNF